MSNILVVVFCTATLFVALSSTSGNLVCYFTSWTNQRKDAGQFNVSHVDPYLCTHILYAFVGLDEHGQLVVLDKGALGDLENLMGLREHAPNLKILVSMGGWTEGSVNYSMVAGNCTKRKTMISSTLDFIEEYQFDGFDLDWEYPNKRDGVPEDVQNFVTLLKEFKRVLSGKGLILSAAVAGAGATVDDAYDVAGISQHLDMINVMTYDLRGSWNNFVGHHTCLYSSHLEKNDFKDKNVAGGIRQWIRKGADPKKINMGLGTYGRTYTLTNPSKAELNDATSGPGQPGKYTKEEGMLGYNEICSIHNEWHYVWDDEQLVPHRYYNNQWVGYDNQRSLRHKIDFVKHMGLGGAMVWSLDTDDFLGACGNETYPLIREVKRCLGE